MAIQLILTNQRCEPPDRVAPTARLWHPLFNTEATRLQERQWAQALPPHTLMQRAGLAVARLALALCPHAQSVWIACGAGNNGGDGLEAAIYLKQWGKNPVVTWLGDTRTAPPDALLSCHRARAAGVTFASDPPLVFDVCIDALLGLGQGVGPMPNPIALTPTSSTLTVWPATRPIHGQMAVWIGRMNTSPGFVLAVDVPTGLNADTGQKGLHCARACATLSLLTLKPGLFTAHGRDACGDIWLDTLDSNAEPIQAEIRAPVLAPSDTANWPEANLPAPSAWLAGTPALTRRAHASHKGSFGDVAVIGGATGMTGAALLAASGALHFGAGRVFVALLDDSAMAFDPAHPELMLRPIAALELAGKTLVCGCGGGTVVWHHLHRVLSAKVPVVIDADAINSIATDSQLQALLRARASRHWPTILTPHPLEAARLLDVSTQVVQQNRLAAAQELANRFNCVVALKGSGTVIAASGHIATINPTGNAALATAGTGDVLAGMIGARLSNHWAPLQNAAPTAQAAQQAALSAAREAVYWHGFSADAWQFAERQNPQNRQTLSASRLIELL